MQFVEVSTDAEVLGMSKFLFLDRTIDFYIAKPPGIYKPLATVKCDDSKSTHVQTYTLD